MPADIMLRRIPFFFLRHGQTDWNARRLCQGQTEVPLNATGVQQAHSAKERLQAIPIATMCCSPLGRARQTAEIINAALERPLVIIDELKEIFFGEAQGKPLATLSYAELLRSAAQSGGETFYDFAARALRGIAMALSHPGPVLIVAHGGIFHAFQSRMRLQQDGRVTNATPVLVEPKDGADVTWSVQPV
jgi:2,3-bisphosphoglycerate-dependent phosphoglycerate mutase